jgi:hypothetical protein
MIEYRITHKQGRNRTGSDSYGRITHAVINFNALCGQNPGRTSGGWSDYDDQILTCPKCKKLLEKLLKGNKE